MSEDPISTYGGEKLERMVEPIGCGVVFEVLVECTDRSEENQRRSSFKVWNPGQPPTTSPADVKISDGIYFTSKLDGECVFPNP